jgi:peptidoglycan/xylan/chitin deacetylase (PgdA/CDA1 family)
MKCLVIAGLLGTLAGCAASTGTKGPLAPSVAVQGDQALVFGEYRIVTVQPGDTLSSLAARHLDDPAKAWLIADFNDLSEVSHGQRLVIPPADFRLGGIYPQGYQVVPVLTYHNFSRKKAAKMIVPEARFEAQMRYLKENGYRTITLDELCDFIEFKDTIPPKSVVITVDDGWRPFYEIAYPILKKYGFKATLFLYTDFVGGGKAVTWDQVKEMAANGIEIHNHTKSHRNLTKVKKGENFEDYFRQVEKEILTAEERLKRFAAIETHYLAYPYGDTNDLVAAFLKKRGYRAGFTVTRGSNPFYADNYRVSRTVIYGDYDMAEFQANLAVFQKN